MLASQQLQGGGRGGAASAPREGIAAARAAALAAEATRTATAAKAAAAAAAAAAKVAAQTQALVDATRANGGSALQVAAAYGDAARVERLLAGGEDPFELNGGGDTALHVAARARSKDVLALLLPVSSWCTVNKEGWTAIDDALYEKVPGPTPEEMQAAAAAAAKVAAEAAAKAQADQAQLQQWKAQQQQVQQQYAHLYGSGYDHLKGVHCAHCHGTPSTGCLCPNTCPRQHRSQDHPTRHKCSRRRRSACCCARGRASASCS
jgi:hypothetical protein